MKFSKFFALLMTLIMVVSMLSVSAFAYDVPDCTDPGGHDGTVTFTDATCTQIGGAHGVCENCGKTFWYSEVPATGHTEVEDAAVAATCTTTGLTEGKHCSACGEVLVAQKVVDALGHTGKVEFSWNIITNEGTGYVNCTVCGEHVTLNTTTTEKTVDATCTEDGKIVYTATCELNGVPHSSTVIKATDKATGIHTGDIKFSWNIITNEGTGYYDCTGCGERFTLETTTTEKTVDATCTEDGGIVYTATCELNGEPHSSTYIKTTDKATGHTEVEDAAVAATCTTTGLTEGKHCSVCGEVLVAQKVVEALGHTEKVIPAIAATCEAAGKTEGKVCSVCDEVLTAQEDIAALGHKWDAGVVTKKPTATAKGETTYTCQNDKAHTKTAEIAALGTSGDAGLDNVPKTGDVTNAAMFGGMMIVALFGAIVTFFSAKKRNNH